MFHPLRMNGESLISSKRHHLSVLTDVKHGFEFGLLGYQTGCLLSFLEILHGACTHGHFLVSWLFRFLGRLLLAYEVGVSRDEQLCGCLFAEEQSKVRDLGAVIREDVLEGAPGFEVGLTQGQEGGRVMVQDVHNFHCEVLALKMAIL
jgi:hypothetical protein